MLEEPLFKKKCPKCGGEKLDYDSIYPQDDIILQNVKCENKDCGYEFGIYSVPKWYISEQEK